MAACFDLYQWRGGDGGRGGDLSAALAAGGRLGLDRAVGCRVSGKYLHAHQSRSDRRAAGAGVDPMAAAAAAGCDDGLDLPVLREEREAHFTFLAAGEWDFLGNP